MLLEKVASGFIFQECKSFPLCDFRDLIFYCIRTLWGEIPLVHLSLKTIF